jgi:hypothetical protein
MKKGLLLLIVVVAAVAVYFLFFNKKKEGPEAPKQQPLALGDRTNAFNNSFNQIVVTYTGVKDALVAGDTAKATAAARQLAVAADSLDVQEMKADSNLKATAVDYAASIKTTANNLANGAGIEAKRKEFQVLADALYTLVRTVQYDGQKLYWLHCPMAFDNTGAYWVSTEPVVRNPYFGSAMLECGEVKDSLDYSKK